MTQSKAEDVLLTFFSPIPDSHALISTKGQYSEVPLYHRKNELFARIGKTFIKLLPSETTSKSGTYWRDIFLSEGTYGVSQGRLEWSPIKKKKAA